MKCLRITGLSILIMVICISGCGNKDKAQVETSKEPTVTVTPAPTETDTPTPVPTKEADIEVTLSNSQELTADYTTMKDILVERGTYIAVVAKGLDSTYWTNVKKGAQRAIKALNEELGYTGADKVRITFEGPGDNSDVDAQINTIDAVLAENPSVLCLSAIDMQSCDAQLETAAENGIPVVIIDSGVQNDLISAACATNNYTAGEEAARKMSEAIGGSGEIAIMAHQQSAQSSMDRVAGFTDEIQKNHPDITIVDTSYENEEKTVDEMLSEVLKGHPKLAGYFCTNEGMTNKMLEALQAAEDTKVQVIGFDSGQMQLDAVAAGKEYGMICQNPYGMGYASMVAAARLAAHLPVDPYISSGYQWIEKSNINLPENQQYLYK